MLKRLALVLLTLATPVIADVTDVVENHIAPRYETLSDATSALAQAARADCTPSAVKPAFHAAYDAWISVSHIQFGPIEDQGLNLAMAFWPDPKDRTGKALARLLAVSDPVVDDVVAFGEVSAAAQGFSALERVLFDEQPDVAYACRLTRAIAQSLAAKSNTLATAWPSFATLMQTAGTAGNTRFQSEAEADQALYTALSTGLEFLHDARLGRPLGTFDRPRPKRAEARRSDRSLHHIVLSLEALQDLANAMQVGELPETSAAFTDALTRAAALNDPVLAGVSEPAKRIRVEALQRTVKEIQNAVNTEIGKPLGITAGFNSLDGD